MSKPIPSFRSAEQRALDHQRWIERHYLEVGRAYTFETHKTWISGWTWYGTKKLTWEAVIRQAESPWMIVALEWGFRTRAGAESWARRYIARGGPEDGYFDPPPPDPNESIYRGKEE